MPITLEEDASAGLPSRCRSATSPHRRDGQPFRPTLASRHAFSDPVSPKPPAYGSLAAFARARVLNDSPGTDGTGATGGLPPPKRERTRAVILDAVDAIAAENGVENVTTTTVTRRGGIAVGTFYRYFPNREAALEAAFDRASERLHECWFASLGDLSAVAPTEAATRMMDSHVAAAATLPAWVPLLEAMRRLRSIASEDERGEERALSSAFAERLGIPFTPANEVRLSVLRTVTGMLTSRYSLAPPEEAATLREEIERLARDSIATMRDAS